MRELSLVIGNKNYSSWSLRPWLAMRHLGLEFDEIIIPLDRPETAASIARHTPAGRVPVLIDRGLHVWESLAILEHLAERHPELWPKPIEQRARARSLAAEMHAGFAALRSALPMNLRASGRKVAIEAATAADIHRIESIWSDAAGPFLFGPFGAVDAMFAPVATRFRTYGVPLEGTARAYAAALLDHPAMRRWQEGARAESWSVAHEEVGL